MHCHKTGWVHSVHTQNPGRAHTTRAVPMSWALLRAQQTGRAHVARAASTGRARSQHRSRAQPAQVARSSCAGRVHSAQAVGASRDLLPLPSPDQVATSLPGRDLLNHQARSRRQSHVATFLLPHQNNPGRDLKMGSRHQFP